MLLLCASFIHSVHNRTWGRRCPFLEVQKTPVLSHDDVRGVMFVESDGALLVVGMEMVLIQHAHFGR